MTIEEFGWLDVDEQIDWLRDNASEFLDAIESEIHIFNTYSDEFDNYVDSYMEYNNGWRNNYENLKYIINVFECYEYVCVDPVNDFWDEFHELGSDEMVEIVEHYRNNRLYPFTSEEKKVEAEKKEEVRRPVQINCRGLEYLI